MPQRLPKVSPRPRTKVEELVEQIVNVIDLREVGFSTAKARRLVTDLVDAVRREDRP